MSYTLKAYIEEKYMDRLIDAAETFIEYDNCTNCSVRIKSVRIYDMDYRPLMKMKDTVAFPTVFQVNIKSCDDGQTYHRTLYLSGRLTGTFSQDFRDTTINIVAGNNYPPKKYPIYYTDDLMPAFENIEQDTLRMLHSVYPASETKPSRIEPQWMAQELHIKVLFANISDDDSILGQYFFKDTTIIVLDEKKGIHVPLEIKARTIVLSKSLQKNPVLMRFTLMHELIHATQQYYALELVRMYNPEADYYICPARTEENGQFMDESVEKLERYADKAAASALMPSNSFIWVASKFMAEYKNNITASNLENVLHKTAEFFGVSIASCRRRFIQKGFLEMRGICNYIDGAYVPSYRYDPSALEKHQTYTVTYEQATKLIRENKKLMKMVVRGLVCFVEHHFVLNSPEYISDGKLTAKARNNMSECALKFDMKYPKGYYTHSRLGRSQQGLFRTDASYIMPDVLYSSDNYSAEEAARLIYERDSDIKEIVKKINSEFSDSLSAVIDWSDMELSEIAFQSWISKRSLESWKAEGSETLPKLEKFIQLCVGMRLPMEVSHRLMAAAGHKLTNSTLHMTYYHFLMFAPTLTIEECIRIMKLKKLDPFAAVNPAA